MGCRCTATSDNHFALGAELAGCQPVVHDDTKDVADLTSQLRVSRDTAAWPTADVHCVYGDTEETLTVAELNELLDLLHNAPEKLQNLFVSHS